MYGNERGVGEALRASGLDRADVFITSKLNNGFHEPDAARKAFAGTLEELGLRLRRPVPHPLAAADALRRRLRLDVEDARGVPGGRPGALDRRLELPGCASRAAGRRRRRRARGEPGRAAPVLPEPRRRCVRPRARDRDRGVGADRAGQGARRRDGERDRRHDRQDARAGRPALAHPARQHRLPEVDDAGPDRGELRALRLRSSSPTTSRRSTRSTAAKRDGTARTRTCSPTCQAEQIRRPRCSGRRTRSETCRRDQASVEARETPPASGTRRRAPVATG